MTMRRTCGHTNSVRLCDDCFKDRTLDMFENMLAAIQRAKLGPVQAIQDSDKTHQQRLLKGADGDAGNNLQGVPDLVVPGGSPQPAPVVSGAVTSKVCHFCTSGYICVRHKRALQDESSAAPKPSALRPDNDGEDVKASNQVGDSTRTPAPLGDSISTAQTVTTEKCKRCGGWHSCIHEPAPTAVAPVRCPEEWALTMVPLSAIFNPTSYFNGQSVAEFIHDRGPQGAMGYLQRVFGGSTAPADTVALSVYESAVRGRQDFRQALVEQRTLNDRLILVLRMIREGVADPKKFAEETLARVSRPGIQDGPLPGFSGHSDACGDAACDGSCKRDEPLPGEVVDEKLDAAIKKAFNAGRRDALNDAVTFLETIYPDYPNLPFEHWKLSVRRQIGNALSKWKSSDVTSEGDR